jgi:ADP-ribosyl-[dinitrogen reductase] hydrolase
VNEKEDAVVGCLLGAAIGDALGLPYEGLSRRRAIRLLGPPDRFRLLGSRGFVSDDTEHLCIVAQSLIAAGHETQMFEKEFVRRLRGWFLTFPAGLGMATLKACVKLCAGLPPSRTGVRSAGNGAAMRASIFGAAVDDRERLLELVHICSRITHVDERAIDGARAVALAAALSSARSIPPEELPQRFLEAVEAAVGSEFGNVARRAIQSIQRRESTEAFAASLGASGKVTGYVLTSVPAALHAWLTSPDDYQRAVTSVIALGGDTDTMAAIAGGIVGCRVGERGLPVELISALNDPPRSIAWMKRLGGQLACGSGRTPPELPVLPLLVRNAMFATIVLGHGVRRIAPPW